MSNFLNKLQGDAVLFSVAAVIILSSVGGAEQGTTPCGDSNGILKYKIGKSYLYSYESYAYANLELGTSPSPAVKINGSVVLTPTAGCEYLLTLQDVVMSSVPTTFGRQSTESENVEVKTSSVKFTLKNGVIEGLHINGDEPSWSVNLKKTILHLIQNKGLTNTFEKDTDLETSVFGDCKTNYHSSENSFRKITHLQECGDGEGSDIISQGISYQLPSAWNKPIFGFLRPTHQVVCEQNVDVEGVISNANCNEAGYKFHEIGFSEMKLIRTTEAVESAEITTLTIPSTIKYNFTKSYSEAMEKFSIDKVKSSLSLMNSNGNNKAESFIELKKQLLRISNLDELIDPEFLETVGETSKKILFDAMAETTTDEAVRVLSKFAIQKSLDATTLFNFYMNIAFAVAPGTKAMDALASLIENSGYPNQEEGLSVEKMKEYKMSISLVQQLLLGASGLAHQYCKHVNPSCLIVPEYQKLVDSITPFLKNEDVPQDILLSALHALGNLDSLTNSAVDALLFILNQDGLNNQPWLEIQALEGFRRDPCQPLLKEKARAVLADTSKTDQLRIHAYLAISRCIVSEDLITIEAVLRENDATVSGFIGSHVRNLRDSSSPSKHSLRASVSQINLPENVAPVYNNSRASKYIEHSTFNARQNLGFSGEAMMIFIPGSARPEFVSFNATVDIFGKSFNFLEVGFSQRLVPRTMMFHGDNEPADWCCLDEAAAGKDSYYRILGTTIALGSEGVYNAIQTSITKLKSTDGSSPSVLIDMLQPSTLLDEEIVYPTISGLPLSYDLDAVHLDSIQFEMIGASSFNDLFSSNIPFAMKMMINGDSSGSVKGSVGFGENTPIHTGYKIDATVIHHQNFEIEISSSSKTETKSELNMKLKFPTQTISRKDVSLDIYSFEEIQGGGIKKLRTRGKEGGMVVGQSLSSQPRKCWDFKILGVTGCVNQRIFGDFPKLVSVTLEKENIEMEGIHVKLSSEGEKFEIDVSTPQSKTLRNYKMYYDVDRADETSQYWESKEVKLESELDKDKFYGRILFNLTQLDEYSFKHPYNYEITAAYSKNDASTEVKIMHLLTKQPKSDTLNVMVDFDGPLKSVGNINYDETHGEIETKKFEWNSDQFGKTIATVGIGRASLLNGSFTAKLEHNNRVYEVIEVSEVNRIFKKPEDPERDSYSSELFAYSTRHKISYSQSNPPKNFMIEAAMGREMSGSKETSNASLELMSNSMNHPISAIVKLELGGLNEINNAYLNVAANGENLVELNTKALLRNGNSFYEIDGKVLNEGGLLANLTSDFEDQIHHHLHLDILCLRQQWEMILDTDITNDGKELKQKTVTVFEDKKQKSTIESESYTVIDIEQRTLDCMSKTTENKDKLLSKFQMNAALPENYLNGDSQASMRLEDGQGILYTGSVNQTVSMVSDESLKSKLNAEFLQQGKTPFTFVWDLNVDNPRGGGNTPYDVSLHVTSDKQFTGEWEKSHFDILVQNDMNCHKKKGQDVYEIITMGNVTANGKLEQISGMQFTVAGNDPKWESGVLNAEGYVQGRSYRDEMTGQLDFEGDAMQRGQHQRVKFLVTRTNLGTKEIHNLVEGTVNKTTMIQSLMDFEMIENGRVKIEEKRVINWSQLFRFHDEELTIFKEIEEIDGTRNVSKQLFLLDVSAKMVQEHHQARFALNSKNSFIPDHPASNIGFTISK